jgi:hypothetical protein
MHVEDKHNIVTPPWWRLWAPRSTSRTWGHQLLPMGSAFSCIFKVDLYWWQSVPCIPLRRTQHRHGAVLCRHDDAKFPPRNCFFRRQADSHYASNLNDKLYSVPKIEDIEYPAYLLGYAYGSISMDAPYWSRKLLSTIALAAFVSPE